MMAVRNLPYSNDASVYMTDEIIEIGLADDGSEQRIDDVGLSAR